MALCIKIELQKKGFFSERMGFVKTTTNKDGSVSFFTKLGEGAKVVNLCVDHVQKIPKKISDKFEPVVFYGLREGVCSKGTIVFSEKVEMLPIAALRLELKARGYNVPAIADVKVPYFSAALAPSNPRPSFKKKVN